MFDLKELSIFSLLSEVKWLENVCWFAKFKIKKLKILLAALLISKITSIPLTLIKKK